MNATETKKPRPVREHRRGLNLNQLENLVTHSIGSTALAGNPGDDFDGIVARLHADTTPWGATVDLTLEPLRPHEIRERDAYIKAVPGTKPWSANVQVHVVGNVIHIARMDNPDHGWVMDATDNDAVISVLFEAGRRARSNTPTTPDAA